MSLGGVVLFEYEIAASLFEKDFDHVGAFAVVINNQDTPLFLDLSTWQLNLRTQG